MHLKNRPTKFLPLFPKEFSKSWKPKDPKEIDLNSSLFVGWWGLRGGIRRFPTPQIPDSTLRFLTFEGITIQLLQQGATTAKHHVISRLDFFPKTRSKKKTRETQSVNTCPACFWKKHALSFLEMLILCRYIHVHIWSISTRSKKEWIDMIFIYNIHNIYDETLHLGV